MWEAVKLFLTYLKDKMAAFRRRERERDDIEGPRDFSAGGGWARSEHQLWVGLVPSYSIKARFCRAPEEPIRGVVAVDAKVNHRLARMRRRSNEASSPATLREACYESSLKVSLRGHRRPAQHNPRAVNSTMTPRPSIGSVRR